MFRKIVTVLALTTLLMLLSGCRHPISPAVTAPAITNSFKGHVIAIVDGDTFKLRDEEGRVENVRLWGADAPESGKPFFKEATATLRGLVFDKDVTVGLIEKDHADRWIAAVKSGSVDVNRAMVASGFARRRGQFSDQSTALTSAESEAIRQRKGIWIDHDDH